MKTINSIKLILSIIAITSFIFLLKSCKKADMQSPVAQQSIQQRMQKDYGGNISASYIIPINQVA